jgi:hypothetical protein
MKTMGEAAVLFMMSLTLLTGCGCDGGGGGDTGTDPDAVDVEGEEGAEIDVPDLPDGEVAADDGGGGEDPGAEDVVEEEAPGESWPLAVSPDGHGIVRREDGAPFFWLGDTQWVLNSRSDEEVASILDDRAARGFTVIQVFMTRNWDDGESPFSRDHDGNLPYVDNDPLQPDGPYFDRWGAIIESAAGRGLYVAVHYGEAGRGEAPWSVTNAADAYEHGRLVGGLLGGHPNIVFTNSQDMRGDAGIGADGWRAMAEGVADGVNGVDGFDGTADYGTTFMTFHPSGGSTSSTWFHGDDWIDANGIQCWSSPETVYGAISDDCNRADPVRPVLLLEGSYENGPEYGYDVDAWSVRQQAWHTYFAGGAGHSYGHTNNWRVEFTLADLGSPGAEGITLLAQWMGAREPWTFVPDQGIITSGEGSGVERKAAVRSSDGDEIHVYFPVRDAADLSLAALTASGSARATWWNAGDGTSVDGGTYATSDTPSFMPPEGWEDAVLTLAAE